MEAGKTRILSCGHSFSEEGIRGWIQQRKNLGMETFSCPTCRKMFTIPQNEEEFNKYVSPNYNLNSHIQALEKLREKYTISNAKTREQDLLVRKMRDEMAIKEKVQKEKLEIYNELQLQAGLKLSEEKKILEKKIKELEKLHKNNLDRKLTVEEMKENDSHKISFQIKPTAPIMNTKQIILKQNVPVLNPEEKMKKKEVKKLKEQFKIKKEHKKNQRLKYISIYLVNKVPSEFKNCTKSLAYGIFLFFKYSIGIALILVLYFIAIHLIPFLLLTLFLHPFLLVTKEIAMFNKNNLFVIDTMKQLVNNNTKIMPPPFDSYQNLPLSYENRVAIAWIPSAIIMILLILNESKENLEISKKIYGTRKYFLHLTYLYRIQSFINWNNTEELQESILAKNLACYGIYIGEQQKKQLFKMLTNDSPRRMCFPVYSWTWNYKPILTNIYIIFYYSQQLFLFICQMYYNKRILLNYYPDLHPIVNIIIYIFSIQNLILISFLISPKFFKNKWCCKELKKKTLTNKEELKKIYHYYNNEYEQIVDLKIESLEIREKNAIYMLVDRLNVRYDRKSNLCRSRICILFTIIGTIIFSIGSIYIIYILKAHYSFSIFQITNNEAYIGKYDAIIYGFITYGPILVLLSIFGRN